MAITAKIKGGVLMLEIPVNNPPRRSGSGKSLLVASDTTVTECVVDGQPLKVSINAYIKA